MKVRLSNWLLAAALLFCVTGIAGFTVAAAPVDWGELADGVRWYGGQLRVRTPVLLPVLSATAVLIGAWLALALHNRSRYFAAATLRMARQPNQQHLLRRASRQIEEAIRRGETGLNCLLGALVDLDAAELRLELHEPVIRASLLLGEGRVLPLHTLSKAQFEAVLAEAALVSGVAEGQQGELELRSRGGADRIMATRGQGPAAPLLAFAILPPGEALASPGKRPRRRSLLLRHDPTPSVRLPTGERVRSSYTAPDEHTDSGASIAIGMEPSAEIEIAPVMLRMARRPVEGAEAWLRLGSALLLVLGSCLLFAPTQIWAARRLLRGEITAPWREIEILVRSRPTGSNVYVAGELQGRTPLQLRQPCRGRALQVVVEAANYSGWQWTGICPKRGNLEIDAKLQPLRR